MGAGDGAGGMIDTERFVREGRARWSRLDDLVARADQLDAAGWRELADLWRQLSGDLARSRRADLPDDLVAWLHHLAARAYMALHGAPARRPLRLLARVFTDVPRQVRADAPFVAVAALLFLVPAVGVGLLSYRDEAVAMAVLPADQLAAMEDMYRTANVRGAGENGAMAGFYVWNNIGIALRCFATGVAFGIGPVWFLVQNGAVIGTVFGHLLREGMGPNLVGFTSGHGAWELTGLVIAGAGGLKLGAAAVSTGGRSRRDSVVAAGPGALTLAVGAALMLAVAAAIEGFWSAGPQPMGVKLAFAVLQVVMVAAWLGLGGRR